MKKTKTAPKSKAKPKSKVTRPRASVHIGSFECGWESLNLFLRPGTGGEFYACPAPGKPPKICVGAQARKEDWGQCMAVLMHEIWEWALFRADLRYSASNRVGALSHADYLFVMNHEQFHACCAKVSEFMVKAVPALAAQFNKWHGAKEKTKK